LTYLIKSSSLDKDYKDIMGVLFDLEGRTKIVLVGLFGFGILLPVITSPVKTFVIFAQTTPISPSSPIPPSSSSGNDTLPSIEITSPQNGQHVPVGGLTIKGTSSDDTGSNCQVYSDVNDITPMKNATASGLGGISDYSNWTFTYTPDYQVITDGVNELTAKISCFDAGTTSVSKYNSVNITGLPSPDTFAAPAPIPSMTG
jgi:hypothetical protein